MAKRTINMCEGPLLPNIILYTLPLIATGLLQLLYNAADMVVVAKWAGGTALAAVGSNGAMINLIVNVFMGLSVGASVAVSQYYGAEDAENVRQVVHSAMGISVIAGIIPTLVGFFGSHQILVWMSTPGDVIDQATLYLKIYFLGMPACMIYNFGAAILRAVGDTKRPLYILAFSGLVNVILNLILVIVFHLDVAGVAIATTVSQILSAVLVVLCLVRSNDLYHYDILKTHIYKDKLLLMMKHGIPAGIQGSVFSISNIIIQSSVNGFESAAMAGNAAASNIEGLIYTAMNAFHFTCLAFMGQNVGACKPDRLRRVARECLFLVTGVGLVLGGLVMLFREPLLNIFTAVQGADMSIPPKAIIEFGTIRMLVICTTYFTCGIMDTLVGAMRGMGSSWTPMLVTVIGVCGVRLVWIFTVFQIPEYHTLTVLYISYPISWIVTSAVHLIFYFRIRKRVVSRLEAELAEANRIE